ncbi:MAG: RidA family protein [Planktomarina sp.]|jgi:2-iminobutanoate/2-iminopropanoate deaminase|nr:RidA family protein [Planktomarina sp.]MDT2056848.1 RidA family protein [Planktomarina sp.]MDT2072138.1 RidA family protein [Planktomarina sp.]MDT2076986.1 RidA family protein [Planktomarina sp.]|tara:strand:+ start:8356 stop:8748 length:393 start_codon:yes stop_codon:yes gene_type:complete
MLKIVNKGAKSNLPFSPAIIAGDLMFVSGQASVDSEIGTIISGTFEEEMRRSIENLRSILVAEGLSLDNVINIKSYVAQQSDLPLYNKIYAEYFAAPLPTRSTIMGVLGTMLKFELDGIACVSTTRQQAS